MFYGERMHLSWVMKESRSGYNAALNTVKRWGGCCVTSPYSGWEWPRRSFCSSSSSSGIWGWCTPIGSGDKNKHFILAVQFVMRLAENDNKQKQKFHTQDRQHTSVHEFIRVRSHQAFKEATANKRAPESPCPTVGAVFLLTRWQQPTCSSDRGWLRSARLDLTFPAALPLLLNKIYPCSFCAFFSGSDPNKQKLKRDSVKPLHKRCIEHLDSPYTSLA